tara:strand:- start:575 stop:781 length:207 start_codon:yes stop_codon:yes gene_type:complete
MALHPAVSERLQSNHVFLAVMRSLWSEYRVVYGAGDSEVGAQVSETDRALSAAFFESLPSSSAVSSLQ